jgi:hypothetical protein
LLLSSEVFRSLRTDLASGTAVSAPAVQQDIKLAWQAQLITKLHNKQEFQSFITMFRDVLLLIIIAIAR